MLIILYFIGILLQDWIFLVVYIDGIIITSYDQKRTEELKALQTFHTKDPGNLKYSELLVCIKIILTFEETCYMFLADTRMFRSKPMDPNTKLDNERGYLLFNACRYKKLVES